MGKKLKIQTENDRTFSEGFEEFIDSCKARNLRPATIKHYEDSYKSILRFIDEGLLVKEINQSIVDNFIRDCTNKLNINSQTLYTYTRDLKTILYFFMRMEYMKKFNIKLPKVDGHNIETYSDAELAILLKKPDLKNCTFCSYRDWVEINTLLSTGIRLSSLINLKVKDIDFENEVIYVNVTKNHKPLIIPLNQIIIKILKEYLKIRQYKNEDDYLFCTVYGKQLNKKTVIGSLAKYNRSRGIVKRGIHRYRHTMSKKFILSGGSPVVLQKILGHSSLLVTQQYLNILVSDLKKEIDQFNILEEFSTNHIKINNGRK